MNVADLVVSGIGLVRRPDGTPPAPAGWFDHRRELGPRGYKYLPPAAQYLLAAVKRALADSADDPAAVPGARRGVVVATNSATSALHGTMDRTVIEHDASWLSPATAPFFAVNLFGSRLSTEHAWQAFNVTLTTPRVAGLEALQAGARAVVLGRADWLLVGAAEEALDAPEPGAEQSESGAVALVVRRGGPGVPGYGRCRVHTGFLDPRVAASAAGVPAARSLLDRAYARLGIDTEDPPPVSTVLDDSPVGASIAAALGPHPRPAAAGSGCLAPLARLAELLTTGAGPALLIAGAAEGNVGVAFATGPAGAARTATTQPGSGRVGNWR